MANKPFKFKVNDVVVPRRPIPGVVIGLTTETRCVVREVKGQRLRIDREDGRADGVWVSFDAVRRFGDPG